MLRSVAMSFRAGDDMGLDDIREALQEDGVDVDAILRSVRGILSARGDTLIVNPQLALLMRERLAELDGREG
jgi:sugar/nucleoside kinase (ribokinase family)